MNNETGARENVGIHKDLGVRSLSELETQVLAIIRDLEPPITSSKVFKIMYARRDISQSTISLTMSKLAQKGILTQERTGTNKTGAFIYTAVLTSVELAKSPLESETPRISETSRQQKGKPDGLPYSPQVTSDEGAEDPNRLLHTTSKSRSRGPRELPKLAGEERIRMEAECDAYLRVLNMGSADPRIINLLCDNLVKLGRTDEALEYLQKLPEGTERDYQLAVFCLSCGKDVEAISYLESIYEETPEFRDVPQRLASLYEQARSFAPERLSVIRHALDSCDTEFLESADHWRLVEHSHLYYTANSDYEADASLINVLLPKAPKNRIVPLKCWFAIDMFAAGKVDGALKLVSTIDAEPAAVPAYYEAARRLVERQDFDKANVLLSSVYSIDPDYADAGVLLEMLGKPRLGRFALIEQIGSGANAAVWKAYDLFTGSRVALKVLHESSREDSGILEEFAREYQTMRMSAIPGIARVVPDSHEGFGGTYFAMELLDGSLADILEQPVHVQGLPIGKVAELAEELAEILLALHESGLVFQDLAPDNIMFRRNRIKVCDLGGIKGIDLDSGHTTFGDVVAHVIYASPEQCYRLTNLDGNDMQLDHRSDIYCFGVMLYHMLTGSPPFTGDEAALTSAHRFTVPRPPIAVRPDIPVWLSNLVLDLLKKEPEARPQSMRQVLDSLYEGWGLDQ